MLIETDIAIIGAGPVGLALAGWLKQRSRTHSLSVALIDSSDASSTAAGAQTDPRALALSHGSRVLLEALAWPSNAAAIRHIHISQQGYFGRTRIHHHEHNVPALGYVVRYAQLVTTLSQALAAIATPHSDSGLRWLTHTSAQHIAPDESGVTLTLQQAHSACALRARIVINAEGTIRASRTDPPLTLSPSLSQHSSYRSSIRSHNYEQTALVATVQVARPHSDTAWERFTSEGPLALLPLGNDQFSLVWCCRPEAAQARAALPPNEFLQALQQVFGSRMGAFTQVSDRATFALNRHAVTELIRNIGEKKVHPENSRTVVIGNAAQTLHPVAGQGLNLGLRDAQVLVDALGAYGATPHALRAYAKNRTVDRHLAIALTDMLARIFTVDFAPLGVLRGSALVALDCVPTVKHKLSRQMMFGWRN